MGVNLRSGVLSFSFFPSSREEKGRLIADYMGVFNPLLDSWKSRKY